MPRGRCCGRCAVARILQQAAERMLYAFLRMLLELLPQCRGGAALRAVRGHCVPSLRCGRGANALIGILLLTDATTPTTRTFKHSSSQTDMLPRAASAQAHEPDINLRLSLEFVIPGQPQKENFRSALIKDRHSYELSITLAAKPPSLGAPSCTHVSFPHEISRRFFQAQPLKYFVSKLARNLLAPPV